mmetsp:Transcript_100351/g.281982  ORF Transcript_100351/g.281982 Transcript_100351/m.281982 type:complete len:245 (+) Transcript_100351:78-812(+)
MRFPRRQRAAFATVAATRRPDDAAAAQVRAREPPKEGRLQRMRSANIYLDLLRDPPRFDPLFLSLSKAAFCLSAAAAFFCSSVAARATLFLLPPELVDVLLVRVPIVSLLFRVRPIEVPGTASSPAVPTLRGAGLHRLRRAGTAAMFALLGGRHVELLAEPASPIRVHVLAYVLFANSPILSDLRHVFRLGASASQTRHPLLEVQCLALGALPVLGIVGPRQRGSVRHCATRRTEDEGARLKTA